MNKKGNSGHDKKDNNAGDFLWITSLGINLVLSSVVGIFIGYYLDKWLHTSPILMFVFFLLGAAAGFRQILKEMKKIDQNDKQNSNK